MSNNAKVLITKTQVQLQLNGGDLIWAVNASSEGRVEFQSPGAGKTGSDVLTALEFARAIILICQNSIVLQEIGKEN